MESQSSDSHSPGATAAANVQKVEPTFEENMDCGGSTCGLSVKDRNSREAKERKASIRKLLIAVFLCFIFMCLEVVGGIKANSLAILTDAAHLLSDLAAFGISLFSIWAAGWAATPRQSYGFFRVEILGALVSIQLIWLLTAIIVYEAIMRLIHGTGEVRGALMFAVAGFGLVLNISMAILLGHNHGHGGHEHKHDHDHMENQHGDGHRGNSHGEVELNQGHNNVSFTAGGDEQTQKQRKKKQNINVRSAYLHVLGDSAVSG
ncbi:Metal tolerance protein A2 [Apostasia shenzhenica]|uniref:Metal tolerance protein A2 n=1 Tax=Apostasia shenzhenica TaxID=1088818 RepID=A0A2I0B6B3_9ASPA|nr:Metal tolerance protein A2 [Apostasia shenzhenica]